MRASLSRLRDSSSISNVSVIGSMGNSSSAAGLSGASFVEAHVLGTSSSQSGSEAIFGSGGSSGDLVDGLHGSKWLHHIAAVLRGAVTTADSILLNFPVLSKYLSYSHCKLNLLTVK